MLTTKQERVFKFIQDHIEVEGYAPTVREIAKGLELKSTSTVHRHLTTLQEKGYILKLNKSPRTMKILKSG